MFLPFLKTSFRNLTKTPAFSIINISGLTIGITCFLLLMEYVAFEKNANSDNKNLNNIYRVVTENSDDQRHDSTVPGLAEKIADIPGVLKTCRIANGIGSGVISYDREGDSKESMRMQDIVYADGTLPELFDVRVINGRVKGFYNPNNCVLSASMSKKLFNKVDAVGHTLTISNQFGTTDYTITAVIEDAPDNSDFKWNILLSLSTLANRGNLNGNEWANLDGLDNEFATTWIMAEENAARGELTRSLNLVRSKLKPDDKRALHLQSGSSVHLADSLDDPNPTFGNLKFVYLLSAIGFLILILAWFNYVNLSTGNALTRAKEVGVRKTIGASRSQLIFQFLSESIIINVCSVFLALALANILQNPFNSLVGKPLSLSYLNTHEFIVLAVVALLGGTFLAGGYVSFVLTGFRPSQVLKGKFSSSLKGQAVRKSLVTIQFAIAIILVTATVVLYSQLQYIKTKDLGMDVQNVLVVRGPEIGKDSTYRFRSNMFMQKIRQLSYVRQSSISGCVPGGFYSFNAAGITTASSAPGGEKLSYGIAIVDENFFDTYQIKLIAGKNFTYEMCDKRWDEVDKIMLNESAVEQLGFQSAADAIGKTASYGKAFEIIGVVSNYNHTGLLQVIDPVIFYPQRNTHYTSIKFAEPLSNDKLAHIQTIFKEAYPGNPCEYFFADESYSSKFADEQRYGLIFITAACLAISITIIGLLGLTTFLVNQRKKEISLRKIFGASLFDVSRLITTNFITQIIVGSAIGLSIAWFGCANWLESFAYRTAIEWWMLSISFAFVFLLATLTIIAKSITAGAMNPVKNLRNE